MENGAGQKLASLQQFWRCLKQWDAHVASLLKTRPDLVRINEVRFRFP